MDQHDGGYGYPPYEEDHRDAGQGSGARGYRDDPAAYGIDSSQQFDPNATYDSNYAANQPGYDARYRTQQPQGGYADPENPYAPRPIDPAYGYQNPQDSAYGEQQAYYHQPEQQPYGQRQDTGRIYDNPDSVYATRLQMTDYSQRGAAPRAESQDDEGYGYASRGATGRTPVSRDAAGYGYTGRTTTSRTRMPEDVDAYPPRGQTSRTRMPQSDDGYDARAAGSRARYHDERYAHDADDDEGYQRPRSSGKKKRSKFGKFMHALGLYLAQLPSKTLALIGGGFAVLLTVIILLAVLLPNSDRTNRQDDGQLSITDMTPTPSIAPTFTPEPVETVSATPELPPLTQNIAVAATNCYLMPYIQTRLVELGYMDEPEGGYTNKYGPNTKTAIRLFQVKNFTSSEDWDGIIGQGTYSLLMSDQAKAYFLTRGDGDDRTKVITKLVEDVTKLQKRLIELGYLTAGSATGLYGNTTVQAVQTFQEYHGLPMDGKAGQETMKLLYSAEAMTAEVGKANNKTKMSPTPSTSPGATTPSVSP